MRSSGPRSAACARTRTRPEREPPVPADVFRTLWRRYEQAKERANRIDFEDMLTLAVELYETDADALALTHRRYSWFSVDEYQDTNRLQEDLLRLWLGDRRDLCVVGDPDQTIYSFTGASSEYLATFADRYPGARVVRLGQNYRSTPQVLALANRLIPGRELRSTLADGPMPELVPHADGDAEAAAVVARIRALMAEGVPVTEIAILVRTNAQLVAFEAALTAPRSRSPSAASASSPAPTCAPPAARCDAMPTGRLSRVVATDGATSSASTRPSRRDRRRGARPPRGALHAARHRASARGRAAGRHRRRLPRRARPPRCRRGRCRRRRRHPLDPASGQGPRVGRRLPAAARGGHAADPPVRLRRRCARRGAPPPVRRHHPRPPPPRAVVGGQPHRGEGNSARARPSRFIAELWPNAVARPAPKPGHHRPPPSSSPLRTSRCSSSSSSGAGSVPVPTACRPTSWPTTRPSPPSPSGGRRTRRRCWACPASVSARSPHTATRSWRSLRQDSKQRQMYA